MKEELIALLKTFEVYGITSTLEKNEDLENHYQLTFSSPSPLDVLFESAVIDILDTLGIAFISEPCTITTAINELSIPLILLNFRSIPKLLAPASASAPTNNPAETEVKEIVVTPNVIRYFKEPSEVKEKPELPEAVLQALREIEIEREEQEAREDRKSTCQTSLNLKINHLTDILDRDTNSDEKANPASYVQAMKKTVKTSYQTSKNVFFNPYLNTAPTAVWLRYQLSFYIDIDDSFSYEQLEKLFQFLDARYQHVPSLCDKAKNSRDEKLTKRYENELELLGETMILTGQLMEYIKEENGEEENPTLETPKEESDDERSFYM